ncbi:uncharacterized protein LOC110817362 [Carica papaya]|uniref:uncharacterized protein LOC110817362 n=1 Tax=Carica papaya TaxID=3649 RepID=UPI000B8CD3D6|nr:uncharacterized protein LOC110817362 [Carica papaya]
MLAPPWLESLLSASFFTVCPTHSDTPRSECNMFCLDCNKDAFCIYCRSSRHQDHSVIQIRRSSYHDVVRVSEIQKVLDISGVQTYVINSARVLFLNERPQLKAPTGKAVSHLCKICGRSLLDPYRFCSLGCKLEGVKRNGDAIKKEEEEEEEEEEEGGSYEGSQREIVQDTPPSPPRHTNSRRRKGIPQRAPLGS